MAFVVQIVTALIGVGLVLFGTVYAAVFLMARTMFGRSLKSEVANSGRAYVESVAERISNPWVRRVVNKHVGSAVGAAAVSLVQGALTSRMRMGLWVILAGFGCFIAAFYVPSWLPLILPGT